MKTFAQLLIIVMAAALLPACAGLSPRQTVSQSPAGENSQATNQVGLANVQIQKLAEEVKGIDARLNAQAEALTSEMRAGRDMMTSITTTLQAQIASVAAGRDVNTSMTVETIMKLAEAQFNARMDARLGDIEMQVSAGRDLLTSMTMTMALMQQATNQTATAGRDVHQSTNKFGGLMTSLVALAAIVAVVSVVLATRANNAARRAIARADAATGELDQFRRSLAPPRAVGEATLKNWDKFAPPVAGNMPRD